MRAMERSANQGDQPAHTRDQQHPGSKFDISGPGSLSSAQEVGSNLLLFQRVKAWSGIEVARYRFPPGERKVSPLRGHVLRLHQSDPHYLVQRLGGRTQASTETSSLITIIPADLPFEQVFQVESEDLNVVLPDRFIRRAAADSRVDPARVEILDRFCTDDPYVRHIGLALGAELDGDSLGEQLYAESLAYALAVHLVRKYSTLAEDAVRELAAEYSHRLSSHIMKRVTDYIGENLDSRLTLSDIADAANLSPFHFSRLFKTSTGVSPHQYVTEQRLQRARELLIGTDLPIHEIAWQTGFSDQSHLGRHMRRRFGITPKSLR
jgi:AraC family transcriptional regulator